MISGETEEAARLYDEGLQSETPVHNSKDAQEDLVEWWEFFPDHEPAQAMLAKITAYLETQASDPRPSG
ncbi:MAG: hypothetical protein H6631_17975 [Anaerolineaceae bacterium]|nr:hypothetical protein [Anaerolineaceae bacterium]MCB9101579.1 hypothetical protein [Anaerolineales bacterium]